MQNSDDFPALGATANTRNKQQSVDHLMGNQSIPASPAMLNKNTIGAGDYRTNNGSFAMGAPVNMMNYPSQLQQQQQQQGIPPQLNQSTPLAPSMAAAAGKPLSDRFGLMGLLGVIRMTDPDLNTLALGCDLTTLGLNLNSGTALNKSFISPWAEQPLDIGQGFSIPDCYRIPQLPALSSKLTYLSDETLFYIFYSMPRDVLQEAAAQELYNRNWRYHKELKTWLTKDPNAPDSVYAKTAQFEKGLYVFWDIARWCKVSKEFVLHYELLEERSNNTSPAPIGTKAPSMQTANGSNNGSLMASGGLGGLQQLK